MKLPQSFYTDDDVVKIAQELLGKYLFSHIEGEICAGMIVETEAYCGATDRACHAYPNRRTARTEIMFAKGGVAYVYLCYGIHHLFNVVTNQANQADAVLIRAIEPKIGEEIMLKRRNLKQKKYNLTAGPGAMSQALAIQTSHYGTDLQGDSIWIENRGVEIHPENIIASSRVGVGYAGEDALLPWRFRVKDNPWCSQAK
jgi:DNA-3-methyladenine glycosylase